MPQALLLPFSWVGAHLAAAGGLAAAPVASTAAATAATAGLGASIGKIGLSVGLSLVASALMPKPSAPKPATGQVETQQSIPPRSFVYGRMMVSGPLGLKKKELEATSPGIFKIVLINEEELDQWETLYGDSFICIPDGTGTVTNGPFHQAGSDKLHLYLHDGTDSQAADARLLVKFPDLWTTDHRLLGIAYALMEAAGTDSTNFQQAYPNGEPVFKTVIRGRKIYDPRDSGQDPDNKSTWMWSDNPVLCALDWCAQNRNGYALGLSRFDLPAFEDMADLCDELVPLSTGGSEKRYRVATQVFLREPRTDVLGRLRMACDGHLYKSGSGGQYAIRGGKWTSPGVTIDASKGHIIEAKMRAGIDALSRYNEAEIRYLSPDHGYAEQECDSWQRTADDEYVAGKVRRTTLDLTMAPSYTQARRLAKIYSAYDNPDFIGSLRTNHYGGMTIGESCLTLLWSETTGDDIDGGDFFIEPGLTMLENLSGMQIPVRSADPTAYDWDETTEEGTKPKPLPPADVKFDEGVPPSNPTDFAVTPGTRSATTTWTFESVHDSENDGNHRWIGRVWRAAAGGGFANAVEVSGPRFRAWREAEYVETWTDSVAAGAWDYFLTIENANSDRNTPVGPVSVTVT